MKITFIMLIIALSAFDDVSANTVHYHYHYRNQKQQDHFSVSTPYDKVCGTNKCKPCGLIGCYRTYAQNTSDMDRDKDVSDLKPCPTGYKQSGLIYFKQWLVADVYLRKCTPKN